MSDDLFRPLDGFERRHLGSTPEEIAEMLAAVGCNSVEELVAATVPDSIRLGRELAIDGMGDGTEPGESALTARLAGLA